MVLTLGSYLVIIYCSGAQIRELNICAEFMERGPDDDGQAALPPWVTALPKSYLSPMVVTTAASAAATVKATKLGPGSSLAKLGPWAPWVAQTCGCVPDHQASYSLSGLHALGLEPTTHSAVWYLYCSHTCSIVPSDFS